MRNSFSQLLKYYFVFWCLFFILFLVFLDPTLHDICYCVLFSYIICPFNFIHIFLVCSFFLNSKLLFEKFVRKSIKFLNLFLKFFGFKPMCYIQRIKCYKNTIGLLLFLKSTNLTENSIQKSQYCSENIC